MGSKERKIAMGKKMIAINMSQMTKIAGGMTRAEYLKRLELARLANANRKR